MKKKGCFSCDKEKLSKDEVGLSIKFLGEQTKKFYCINCLADYLDITTDDLLAKIEEYKEQGCVLF